MVDPRKFDPSGTGAIQRAFIKDLTQRFARLKRAVWRLVVDEDAFGIGDGKPLPVGPTLNTRWKFVTGPEKMKQFENWLDGQIKAGILSEDGSGNGDVTGARYIRSTYKQALVSTYRKVNKDTLQGSAGDFYEGTQNAFLKDTFESSEAASKMAMLGTRVYSSLKDITSTMDAKMSRVLAQGLADGKSPREVGRQLAAEVDGISKARGARIARTEIIHTHAEGQLDAFEALKVHDLIVMAEWLTTPDKKLCSKCAELEGVVLTVPEARGLLPRHPNCVVGESKVRALDPTSIMRAKYAGKVVEITTSKGSKLTVTEHHILLTNRGWVFAKDLKQSDYLFDSPLSYRMGISAPDNDDLVATIEDVFHALLELVPVGTVLCANPRPVDFHGDGSSIQQEVYIASPNRKLWSEIESKLVGQGKKFPFVFGGDDSFALNSLGLLQSLFQGTATAADGFMGIDNVLPILFRGTLCHHHLVGQFDAAGLDAIRLKDAAYHGIAAVELSRQLSGGNSPLVKQDDFTFGELKGCELSSITILEAHECSPIWVYDISTASTLYDIGGIISSNCRCAWIPADVGESKKGQIRSKAGIEGAIERSVKEERPNAETKDAFKLSKWLGADVKVDTRPKSVDSLPMFAPAEGLWGQQPTAVMRWMGKEGWNAKDAQRVLKEMGVDAAEGTIKTQLGAGVKGLRGPAASLTDEQVAILRAKKAGEGIIKPPPIKPPIAPPPVLPPPVVTPPAIVPPTIPGDLPPIPKIVQPGTSVARWLGKEGFSFQDAKKVLAELDIKISDATLKTQLGAGAKGLRGAVAALTDAQAAALRARRVLPPPGLKPPRIVKPKVTVIKVAPPPAPVAPPVVKPPSNAVYEELTPQTIRQRISDNKILNDLTEKVAAVKSDLQETYDDLVKVRDGLREEYWKQTATDSDEIGNKLREANLNLVEMAKALENQVGDIRKKAHALLQLPADERLKIEVTVVKGTTKVVQQKGEDARKFLQSITKKEEGRKVKFRGKLGGRDYEGEVYKKDSQHITLKQIKGRAYAQGDSVHLDAKDGVKIHVHEMAHTLEGRMPLMQDAAQAFRQARIAAAGTSNVRLKDALPGYGFKEDEFGNEDDFGKFFKKSSAYYCGKKYSGGATEIISMGTEALYDDPVGFAKKDPEYFKFIVGLLRGDL